MAGFLFNTGSYRLLAGTTVWTSSPIRFRLCPTAQGALNIDAANMSGLATLAHSSQQITPSSPVGPTQVDADDHVKFTSGNAVFTAANAAIGACNRLIMFHFITDDASSFPIAYCDITAVTPNGGDVTVTMDALGWFYMQQHA